MTLIACLISSLTTSRILKSWGLREEFLIFPINGDFEAHILVFVPEETNETAIDRLRDVLTIVACSS